MVLEKIDAIVKERIDVNLLKRELDEGLQNLLSHNPEIKEDLEMRCKGEDYYTQYSGVSIFVLNSNTRGPYMWARLKIYTLHSKQWVAWYDVEYDDSGAILDDYFDFES